MILNKALITCDTLINRRFHDHVRRVSYFAKCFIFDAEASRLIGQFANECSDLVFNHRQFAKPPYDTTYIEYDGRALHIGLSGGEIAKDWEDQQTGFLVHNSVVYCFAGANEKMGTPDILWPIFYFCGDRNTTVDHKSDFPVLDYGTDGPVSVKLALIMGKAFELMMPDLDRVWIEEGGLEDKQLLKHMALKDKLGLVLLDLHNSNQAYWGGSKRVPQKALFTFIRESLGDLKKLWAGLLWLQSVPKSVSYNPVPGGATLFKGKRVAMSDHHTVHIHLKGAKLIRRKYMAAAGKRNSPREHEVRGHWSHRGGMQTGCSHVWPDNPNEKGQFICEKCQRKRWYRKSFKRGDKAKGFVTKDYKAEL